MIADYTPLGWQNDGPPAVNRTNLRQMDDAIDAAIAELRRLAGDPAAPNTAINFDATLRVGSLTHLGGNSGLDVAALNYLVGYVGSGISFDGTDWQAPGDGVRNGWACIGFHADGTAYLYGDSSTGAASRTYTKAQFLAKRIASIVAAPSGLSQEGAVAGDFIGWNAVSGKYAPMKVPNPARVTVAQFAALVPADGDEVYLEVDAAGGVYWHLKYRAASASAYKWEFVGGPPLYSLVAPAETTTSGVYVALTTPGPSIALPRPGDYDVEIGTQNASEGSASGRMSFDIGATAAVDADNVLGGYTAQLDSSSRRLRKIGLAAVTLTAKYRSNAAPALTSFRDRYMSVLPVRLG